MKKLGFILVLWILLSINFIEIVEGLTIEKLMQDDKTIDILTTSYKEISIKLMKDGTLYRERSVLFLPDNAGKIISILPINKSYISLEIYNLKSSNKERLVRYYNVFNMTNCSGYYSVSNEEGLDRVYICPPKSENNEVEIEVDLLLFNDEVPSGLKKEADYYISLPNISLGYQDHVTTDFRVRVDLSTDDGLLLNKKFTQLNCYYGLKSIDSFNSVFCEGNPELFGFLYLGNIKIYSIDKEKKDKRDQLNRTYLMAIITGLVFAIILSCSKSIFEKYGEKIFNKLPWNESVKIILFLLFLAIIVLLVYLIIIKFI